MVRGVLNWTGRELERFRHGKWHMPVSRKKERKIKAEREEERERKEDAAGGWRTLLRLGSSDGTAVTREILHTFTILTTRSSTALQWLHDRMPVILGNKGSIDVWLEKSTPKLEAVLGPYEDSDLVWYPVTTAVGKPSFDGPECVKEINLKSSGENPMSKFFSKKVDKSHSEPEHKKSSNQFPETDAFGSVKDELDAEGTGELAREEKNGKSDLFALPKGETIESDVCGIKREFEEMATSSVPQTETAIVLPASPVKKGKSIKSTGDRQASLLSYFGKR
ncbi:hypothetical protein COCNU_scaffold001996G000020 [Cocos nucifera]|nr:hypothetical protein [Cocos nucifera]